MFSGANQSKTLGFNPEAKASGRTESQGSLFDTSAHYQYSPQEEVVMKKGKQKKVVTQSEVDRRSEQLNPLSERFLQSRQTTLTQEDVSRIQKTEF